MIVRAIDDALAKLLLHRQQGDILVVRGRVHGVYEPAFLLEGGDQGGILRLVADDERVGLHCSSTMESGGARRAARGASGAGCSWRRCCDGGVARVTPGGSGADGATAGVVGTGTVDRGRRQMRTEDARLIQSL